jgi:hypothetical protein
VAFGRQEKTRTMPAVTSSTTCLATYDFCPEALGLPGGALHTYETGGHSGRGARGQIRPRGAWAKPHWHLPCRPRAFVGAGSLRFLQAYRLSSYRRSHFISITQPVKIARKSKGARRAAGNVARICVPTSQDAQALTNKANDVDNRHQQLDLSRDCRFVGVLGIVIVSSLLDFVKSQVAPFLGCRFKICLSDTAIERVSAANNNS